MYITFGLSIMEALMGKKIILIKKQVFNVHMISDTWNYAHDVATTSLRNVFYIICDNKQKNHVRAKHDKLILKIIASFRW